MEKLDKNIFQKWHNWLLKIKDDLQEIINYKQINKYFEEVVNANLEHIKNNNGQIFCDFVRKCYAISAAVCIRRHAEINNESISLMKLLDEIKRYSEQFTYEFYLEQYPLDHNKLKWQKITFDNFSRDGRVVSEKVIEKDMQELLNIAGKVKDFVDRAIAHLDSRGPKEEITYGDLTDSLDLFNKIVCKYITFISSLGYITLEPTIPFDWQKIFTVPVDARKNQLHNPDVTPGPVPNK